MEVPEEMADKAQDIRRRITANSIADLRSRLLDLTNRNRLVNFRFNQKSRTQVRVIDELPNVLFDRIISEKELIFAALPEPSEWLSDEKSGEFALALAEARLTDEQYLKDRSKLENEDEISAAGQRIERMLRDRVRRRLGWKPRATQETMSPQEYAKAKGLDPSWDLPRQSAGEQKKSHGDNYIQTLLFPDLMESRLSAIRDGARTAFSEMGVNVLFAVFGFLEWYESESADSPFFSPLLFQSVKIERTLVRQTYRYSIVTTGDETEINLTLQERLSRDFGFVLPELEEEDTPESYFAKVQSGIKDHKRWRVRRFVNFGLFSFARLAMYHDLDPTRWPGHDPLDAKPILNDLLSGHEQTDSIHPEEYDVDKPKIERKVPLLITDADSSQFSAIVDIMEGRNLVIKGPPGTGKSQTITNLIAAALSKGQSILFLAEKMAALDVVKKRLDDAGLGDFILELHSTKAHKKEVLNSLSKRLAMSGLPDPSELDKALSEFQRLRERLTRYADIMNDNCGDTGEKLHDLFWAGLRARDLAKASLLPATLDVAKVGKATKLTAFDLDTQRTALSSLEHILRSFPPEYQIRSRHPWSGVDDSDLSPFQQEQLLKVLEEWQSTLNALREVSAMLESQIGITGIATINSLHFWASLLDTLPKEQGIVDFRVLGNLYDPEIMKEVKVFCSSVESWHAQTENLLLDVESGKYDLASAVAFQELVTILKEIEPSTAKLSDPISKIQTYTLIGSLPKYRGEFRHVAQSIDDRLVLVRRLVALTDPNAPLHPQRLRILLDALSIARTTAPEVLRKRLPSLFPDHVRRHLVDAETQASRLKKARIYISENFILDPRVSSASYREQAKIIKNAGLVERLLGKRYKAACQTWLSSCKNHSPVQRELKSKHLDDIATYLEEVATFSESSELKAICGMEFLGIDSDFASLLKVQSFASAVNEKFSGQEPFAREARKLLLEESPSKIEGILSEITEETCKEIEFLLKEYISVGLPAGEGSDLRLVRESCASAAETIDRIYRSAKKAKLKDTTSLSAVPDIAKRISAVYERKSTIDAVAPELRAILGPVFEGVKTDIWLLARTVDLATKLRNQALEKDKKPALFDALKHLTHEKVQFLSDTVSKALQREGTIREKLSQTVRIDYGVFFRTKDFELDSLGRCAERVSVAIDHSGLLPSWVEHNRLRLHVEELGLASILEAYENAETPLTNSTMAFNYVFYRSILAEAYKRYPEINEFSGIHHESLRRRFQEIDKRISKLQRQRLASELSRRLISPGVGSGPKKEWTQRALILHEIAKERRHIPLRELMKRADDAIQEMKPCWMMSPASVAQFLQPGNIEFDLVVIDEASQMRPEEAIGGIARGKQLVVVGDEQQLPPTSFFERTETTIDDDEENEDAVENTSILDQARSIYQPHRELRWHYRSRHESLIAFSNKNFYNQSLTIFPTAMKRHADYGIEFRKVDGLYKGGVNLPEAQAVALAAVEFMHKQAMLPEADRRSLGVAIINQKQRDIVAEEIDRLLAGDTQAEKYRIYWEGTLEPMFVKNLENVQGDERDVIFISTVYGPEQPGARVHQRFGPINSVVGHRRLNVLFTRAKEKVVVFSSMASTDILPNESTRRGVGILKDYLVYSSTGKLDAGTTSGREPDTDFEIVVANRLRQQGFDVVPQVGVAGYFIDLGVKDPRKPDVFLLGIECDGATYHSAKSARDRDRLREDVLRQKKWNIYRIWSTDWFRDPDRETSKLLAYIKQLLRP